MAYREGATDEKSFNEFRNKAHNIDDSEELIKHELALNDVRIGSIGYMFHYLGLNFETGSSYNRNIADYHASPNMFYEDMNLLVSDLEKDGW